MRRAVTALWLLLSMGGAGEAAAGQHAPHGRAVTIPVRDGADAMGYEVPAAKPSHRVVLMFHEWWGLNDDIRREAERLRDALGDATVLAVDLYDGRVATTRDEAIAIRSAFDTTRAHAIVAGAISYAGDRAEIATIGWCFGGAWSLRAAIAAGVKARACVVFYGTPETDPAKLAPLHAPVLGIFGLRDANVTPEVVASFRAAMHAAGKSLDIRNYDAGHAFANPASPNHSAVAAADAWKRTLAFLRARF